MNAELLEISVGNHSVTVWLAISRRAFDVIDAEEKVSGGYYGDFRTKLIQGSNVNVEFTICEEDDQC